MPFVIRRKIPRDALRTSMLNQLCKKGRMIRDLDAGGGITQKGSVLQATYADRSVWHNLDGLKGSVAEELGLGPELFGPSRKNDDFNRMLLQELCKLRKSGQVSVWNDRNWRYALRLTDSKSHKEVYVTQPVLDLPSPRYDVPSLVSFGEEADMKRVFGAIMSSRGAKDNTYKFALAKIILDHCKDNASCTIPYNHLAHEFLRHYWYQKYKYRMKQDFKTERRPEVINILDEIFGDKNVADFNQLKKGDVQAAKAEILKRVFGHARKKTSLVVPRFQNIPGDGGTIEYNIFYSYDDDMQAIRLRPEAHDFFKRNYTILSMTVIAAWAKFLERINGSIPRLMSKVEAPDKKRGSMQKYYKLLSKHESCCFYCRSVLEKDCVQVDHFIPWSYIFEDELWNLVLACQDCNCEKSNKVASEEFKDCLIHRNIEYRDMIGELRLSLERLDRGSGWEPEIDNHYKTCLMIEPGRFTMQ